MASQATGSFAGEVELVEIDTLHLDPSNPNEREDVDDIRASLSEFGQHKPIVAQRSTGRIIIGNHTWQAAKLEGWTEVQAMLVDDDDLKAMRRGLADNRIGEKRQFSDPILKSLLDEAGQDVPGFDEDFVSDLVGRLTPQDLDDLADEHGDGGNPDDFWPVLRIKLPPELKKVWDRYASDHDDDLSALRVLLGAE